MSAGAIPARELSPRWRGRKVPLRLVALPPVEEPSVWDRLRTAPAWAVSAAVHVAVLAVLAGITIVLPSEIFPAIVSEIAPDDIDRFKVETVNLTPEVGNDSAANVLSPSKAASSDSEPVEQELQREVEIADVPVALAAASAVTVPSDDVLTAEFDATGLTEYTGGVEGAIDVLTREIAASLRENRTTVVWMLDASLSLAERREKIAERVEAVYAQLGNTGDITTDHLESAVATFGGKTDLLTSEPVADPGVIVDAIRSVEPDETGEERVFAALKEVGRVMLPERTRKRRNLLFVIVTDERGDDPGDLENVIGQFKRYGIPVYCVGNAAPFGRDVGYVMHSWKEGFIKYIEPLPVDAGPETVLPERLRLGFWGPGGDVRGENLSSGYGPYALTRLCVETGGMYLVADDNNAARVDPTLMRSYPPDYRPIADYTRDVRANRAKSALVEAAGATKAEGIPSPQLVFPAVDDTRLRREIDAAQRPMALIDYRLTGTAKHARSRRGRPRRDRRTALAGGVRPGPRPRAGPAGAGPGVQHRAGGHEERPEAVRAGEQQRVAAPPRRGVRRRRRGEAAHRPQPRVADRRDRAARRHPLGAAGPAGARHAAGLAVGRAEQRSSAGDGERGDAGRDSPDVRPGGGTRDARGGRKEGTAEPPEALTAAPGW